MENEKLAAMPAYLQQLFHEIEQTLPEMFPPRHPRKAGEEVIGTCTNPYLRRLYSLMHTYSREIDAEKVNVKYSGETTPGDHEPPRLDELRHRHDLLAQMFWAALSDEHKLWGEPCGMRRDWLIVAPCDTPNKMPEFLRQFLDGN